MKVLKLSIIFTILIGSIGLITFLVIEWIRPNDQIDSENSNVGIGNGTLINMAVSPNRNAFVVTEGLAIDMAVNFKWSEEIYLLETVSGIINKDLINETIKLTMNNGLDHLLSFRIMDYSPVVYLNQNIFNENNQYFNGFVVIRIIINEPTSYEDYRQVVGSNIQMSFMLEINKVR
jgi:hypothetical protein